MRSDALVNVSLLPAADGGLLSSIPVGVYHGIMMFDETQGYDFRSYIDEPFEPGSSRNMKVAFLSPDEVLPLLSVGAPFNIWAGRVVARGHLIEVLR